MFIAMILRMLLRILFKRPNGYGFMGAAEFGAMFAQPRPKPKKSRKREMDREMLLAISFGVLS